MFFMFGQALQSLAIWITTICATSNSAYTAAFSMLLVSVVLQSFLTTSYISFIFFIVEYPFWFIPIRLLLQLIPSYNFSVIFGQISLKSGRHYDLDDNYWRQGPGFAFDDLFTTVKGNIFGIQYEVKLALYHLKNFLRYLPVTMFYLNLLINAALYLIFAWYCDNVISHNRGGGK